MRRFFLHWHRMLGWLGLLALCLAVAGPLVGQGLRLAEEEAGGHAHHGHSGSHHAHHHRLPEPSYAERGALAACDYCEFFLHMPGIPPRRNPAPALPARSPLAVAEPAWPALASRHPRYRGRAPPFPTV